MVQLAAASLALGRALKFKCQTFRLIYDCTDRGHLGSDTTDSAIYIDI